MSRIRPLITIFSKNRPLQLQACIESIYQHGANVGDINVIVKGDRVLYDNVAKEIERKYKKRPKMYYESNFYTDMHRQLDPYYSHWVPCVDDTIFFAPFDLHEGCQLLRKHSNLIGFSLRLGNNTKRCYMTKSGQSARGLRTEHKYLIWDWTKSSGDFGYPLEVSSSIYRMSDAQKVLFKCERFCSPNDMELYMDRFKSNMTDKHMLASYHHSVAVSLPMNLTQSMWANPNSKDEAYSTQELLNKYKQGFRMSPVGAIKPTAAHMELKFQLTKVSSPIN